MDFCVESILLGEADPPPAKIAEALFGVKLCCLWKVMPLPTIEVRGMLLRDGRNWRRLSVMNDWGFELELTALLGVFGGSNFAIDGGRVSRD